MYKHRCGKFWLPTPPPLKVMRGCQMANNGGDDQRFGFCLFLPLLLCRGSDARAAARTGFGGVAFEAEAAASRRFREAPWDRARSAAPTQGRAMHAARRPLAGKSPPTLGDAAAATGGPCGREARGPFRRPSGRCAVPGAAVAPGVPMRGGLCGLCQGASYVIVCFHACYVFNSSVEAS